MAQAVTELADSLESHASSRANFHDVSDEHRHAVAEWLLIAHRQRENEPDNNRIDAYEQHLNKKQNNYFYQCGQAGIDIEEARAMWQNVVER
jgi:hypothetical protein